eukprot:364795-Chlamydomonas_euryale.AAC.5
MTVAHAFLQEKAFWCRGRALRASGVIRRKVALALLLVGAGSLIYLLQWAITCKAAKALDWPATEHCMIPIWSAPCCCKAAGSTATQVPDTVP